jgi:hypothetical protein
MHAFGPFEHVQILMSPGHAVPPRSSYFACVEKFLINQKVIKTWLALPVGFSFSPRRLITPSGMTPETPARIRADGFSNRLLWSINDMTGMKWLSCSVLCEWVSEQAATEEVHRSAISVIKWRDLLKEIDWANFITLKEAHRILTITWVMHTMSKMYWIELGLLKEH